jgi:hypothetical protein
MNAKQLNLFETEDDRRMEFLRAYIKHQFIFSPMWVLTYPQTKEIADYYKVIERRVLEEYEREFNERCKRREKIDDDLEIRTIKNWG